MKNQIVNVGTNADAVFARSSTTSFPFAHMHRIGDTLFFDNEDEFKSARRAASNYARKAHVKFRTGMTNKPNEWAIVRIE